MSKYEASSIQTFESVKHIRSYPGMYIGSKDVNGLHHCPKEIISNSVDEALNGSCNFIHLTIGEDFCIVEDNGRGVPIGIDKSGCSTLQAVFGIMNTGGKYNKDGESGYNTSGGQHGVGAKAVNALSSKFIAKTKRDGQEEVVVFEKGEFVSHDLHNCLDKTSGTVVEFYPDKEIFETINFDYERLKNLLQELAFITKGLKFTISDLRINKEESFYSENGLLDYLNFLSDAKSYICNPFYCDIKDKKSELEIALVYDSTHVDKIKLYANNIPQVSGTHLTGFKTAFTTAINQYAREANLIKEKEENVSGTDLAEGQILILNLKMPDPVYQGQNKEILNDTEARTTVQRLTKQEIDTWLRANPTDAKAIVNKALAAKRARDAAKKAKENVRKKTSSNFSSVLPGKLADANSKDPSKCEIFIVEGDSAGGSAKTARDREFQAVLPLRGKILNTEKATLDKIYANEEIKSMIIAFGQEIKGTKIVFDESKMRYGKIIIMTDADVDGAHIQTLFITFIFNFMPELIQKGYIYVAVPPLYRVDYGKKHEYLQNDEAFEKFKAEHPNTKYELKRFKGLGEMDADQLNDTTMNPETRILKQLTIEDMQKSRILVDQLMGNSPAIRKEFIIKNSHKVKVVI